MNNPVLPLLDGLAGLSDAFLDSAAKKNWTEIEDLEKEQGSLGADARQKLSGTALTTSVVADALARVQPSKPDVIDPAPLTFENLIDDAGRPAQVGGTEDRDDKGQGDFAAPARVAPAAEMRMTAASNAAAEWQTISYPGSPSPVSSPSGSGQAIAAAASGIEYSLAASGSFVAAQKLHAAVRSLSPEQVSALLDRAAGLVATIFEQVVRGEDRGGRIDERQREVRTALALAQVAAAIDKDPRNPAATRLMQDISAVILAPATPNDNTIFSGLAQAIGIGAGAKLALAIAAQLAHRDKNPSRAKALLTLLLAGFVRLGERIDEAYSDLLRHAGPLCIEWIKWRGEGEEEAIQALIDFLKGQSAFLDNLEPRLERLEHTGLEAFRAIRDLAAYSFDGKLRDVHDRFLASRSVFASIAGSNAALKDIRQISLAASGEEPGPSLEMMRLTLTDVGFDAPRAAFLADLSQLSQNALMLGANWTALESFTRMEAQGRAFQRLLAFLNGQYVVAATPDIVGFDDPDMQI
ncbi:hypothetical protein [Rhizobium sp. LC145]|jgi:hypothetical protein|uniref:hypothetical protein n=1 Tax=Rhizobium sp. LC145 TaxID=1120688 RepID=UPI000629EDA0|nr:hypothetical protein [Rhizobium sp. LC145]KKX26161.1 hypothetical protein YH62_23995 [Rhizobium sp. LC145]TKT67099.1 hypothetical protein FDR95_03450 [Rhizobiaceae bacterium LC148]